MTEQEDEERNQVQVSKEAFDMESMGNTSDEIASGTEVDGNKLRSAMLKLEASEQAEALALQLKKQSLAQIQIKKEDVDVIINEFDMKKTDAEVLLRENKGNLEQALLTLVKS